MKIDRRGWVRAVQQATVIWGFQGIQNPRKPYDRKAMTSIEVVLSDERFTEQLHHEGTKYVAESPDYADDWSEYVHDKHHRAGACPHGSDDEREAFERRVAKTLKDESEKYAWASDRVDWDWVKNSVECFFQDGESIYYFLKEHPIDSAWHRNGERWVALEDIRGFCPSCDEVLDDEDVVDHVEDPHVHNPDCENAVCRTTGAHCVFDDNGKLRLMFSCGNCNWFDAVDQDRPDETPYMARNNTKRPFNWPPGAPYPPRRSFSGYPMDVPPYEEP